MMLTRARVARAALELVDREGLGKLTMRSLAQELDVSAMAVYRHVEGKEELLDQLVSHVFAMIELPPADGPWESRLRQLAGATRAVVIAHPQVARLLFDRPTEGGAVVRIVDHIYAALLDAGVAPAVVPRLERLLSSAVLGFAISEASGRFGMDDGARVRRAQGADAPAHGRIEAALRQPVDWDTEFEADLEDLITIVRSTALVSGDTPR